MQCGKIGDENRILDSVWPKRPQSFTNRVVELVKQLFSNTTQAIRNFLSHRVGNSQPHKSKGAPNISGKELKDALIHGSQTKNDDRLTEGIVGDSLKQSEKKMSKREQNKQKKYNFSMDSSSISSAVDIVDIHSQHEQPIDQQFANQYPIEESEAQEEEEAEIENYGHKKVKLADQQPKKKLSPAVQEKMNVIMVESFEKVFKSAQKNYAEDQLRRQNETPEMKYQQYLAENIYGIYPIERATVDKVKTLRQKIRILNEHDNYVGYTPMEEETSLPPKTHFNIPKLMSNLYEEEKNRITKIRQAKEALWQEGERVKRQQARQEQERVAKERQTELERLQMEEKKIIEEVKALQAKKALDEILIVEGKNILQTKENDLQSKPPSEIASNSCDKAAQPSQFEAFKFVDLSPVSKLERLPPLRPQVEEKKEPQKLFPNVPQTALPFPKIPEPFSLFQPKVEKSQLFPNFAFKTKPIQKHEEQVQQTTQVITPKKDYNPFCEPAGPLNLSQVVKNFNSPHSFKFRSNPSGSINPDSEKRLSDNIFSNNFPYNPPNNLNNFTNNTQVNFSPNNPPPTREIFDVGSSEDRNNLQQPVMSFFGSNPNLGSQTFSNGSNSAILSNSGMPSAPPVAPLSFNPTMNRGSFMSMNPTSMNASSIFQKNIFLQSGGGQLFDRNEDSKSQLKLSKSKSKKNQPSERT